MSKGSKKRTTKSAMRKRPANKPGKNSNVLVEKTWRVYGLPLFMAIVFLPLIVRSYSFVNSLYFYQPGESGEKYCVDFFLHYKEIFLYIVVGMAVFFLICMLLLGRKMDSFSNKGFHLIFPVFLPAVYLLLALISSLGSEYPDLVFHGAKDLFQPYPVLLSYGILFYYSWFVMAAEERNPDRFLSYILRAACLSVILLGLIGVLQLLGNDPMSWGVIQKICGLANAEILPSTRIYLTLYHADYVGVLMSMFFPLVLSSCFVEKETGWRALGVLALVLNLINLFGCQSRSGIVAVIIGAILFFTAWIIRRRKDSGHLGVSVAAIIAGVVILLAAVLFYVVDRQTNGELLGRLFRYKVDSKNTEGLITGIETGTDGILLEIGESRLKIQWQDNPENSVSITDGSDNLLDVRKISAKKRKALSKSLKKKGIESDVLSTDVYKVTDDIPGKLRFWAAEVQGSSDPLKGYAFYDGDEAWFFCQKDGKYQMLNHQGLLVDSVISEDFFPESFYGFASYRGYVWSKTIARLPRVMILGSGPDTFSLYFPNNDYAGRHQIGQDDVVYNKPHCWYLQMGAETGMLSALVMIVFLLLHIVRFLSLSGRISDRRWFLMELGIFLGTVMYMITGLANDSMIVAAPVFWVLLGLGEGLLFREIG